MSMEDGMDHLYEQQSQRAVKAEQELESWKRTCHDRDVRVEALEQEVAGKAREIGVLEGACASYKRGYTSQLQLKDMATARAATAELKARELTARLESSRALVERLNNDVIARDEALEATRTELLKQIDMWKEDSAAWRKAWRVVGKIRDQRTAERDMWKEEALRAGRQVVEGNKLREHQAQEHFEGSQVAFGKFSDEILRLEGENRRLRAEHAALLAESTEIARLKLKHHNATQAWAANQAKITAALEYYVAKATKNWTFRLQAQIDHLEAQRAAWFSEISRLETVEEESWGLRITVEEGQEIIGELAGALAHLLDEPLAPCGGGLADGATALREAIEAFARKEAEDGMSMGYFGSGWAGEQLRRLLRRLKDGCMGHNGPKTHQAIKDAREWADGLAGKNNRLYAQVGRQALRARFQRNLIGALRDRIEELEEVAGYAFGAPSSSAESIWKRAAWALRKVEGRHAWHSPQPFWSEKLRRDRGIWTVTWRMGAQRWWVRMPFVDGRPPEAS